MHRAIIVVLFFWGGSLSGQTADSLRTRIKAGDGEQKGLLLADMASHFAGVNADSAKYYYAESLKYLSSFREKSEVHESVAMLYFYESDFLNALENFKLSLAAAKQTGKDSIIARRYSDLGVVYDYLSAYEKSIDYYFKALSLFENSDDKKASSKIYNNLGIISQNRGQAKQSLDYYNQSLALRKEINAEPELIASLFVNIGSLYEDIKDYPKSLDYYHKSLKVFRQKKNLKNLSLVLNNIAGVKYLIQETDSAKIYNGESTQINKSIGNELGLISNFYLLGEIFNAENLPDSSMVYLYKALELSEKYHQTSKMADIYSGLVNVYKKTGRYKEAVSLQDSILVLSDNFNNEKITDKIETLRIVYETEKRDREYSDLQKDIRNDRLLYAGLALGLLLVSIIVVLILRQKLVKARLHTGIFNQRLLRLQMNPHFIFNALASIQAYMTDKNSKQAAVYLSSFSKLTRSILDNSRKDYITVQEDIDTIDNYLKIQQMRFSDRFDYAVEADDTIDFDNLMIPPMLTQPFTENAVVHAFKNINYRGFLKVQYELSGEFLKIIVKDNGKGLNRSEQASKKSSHAINITKERLKILNRKKSKSIKFKLVDLKDTAVKQGIRVVFFVPVVKKY
ncbi:MAG: tetratricopeptide repeat protein [Bacteroidota bacterium]|nr:tetratricopeptide repeat protein [Bacteroidota bacterium]